MEHIKFRLIINGKVMMDTHSQLMAATANMIGGVCVNTMVLDAGAGTRHMVTLEWQAADALPEYNQSYLSACPSCGGENGEHADGCMEAENPDGLAG